MATPSIRAFLTQTYLPIAMPAAETRVEYSQIVGVFERWRCGSIPVNVVTPEMLGEYFTWLIDNGRSVETVLKHRRVLRAILHLARKRRLTRIDVDEIPRPKRIKRLPQAWSPEEFEQLLMAAGELPCRVGPWPTRLWMPALMLTCWSTDWRISAVMGLPTKRVSIERRWAVSLERKTSEERKAKLTEQCADALQAIWDGGRREVFGDWPHDRKVRQWPKLNDLLYRCIVMAGVPDIGRFHAIRRTATTAVCDAAGIEAAQRFAGHRSPSVTRDSYVDPTKIRESHGSDVLPRLRIDRLRKPMPPPLAG